MTTMPTDDEVRSRLSALVLALGPDNTFVYSMRPPFAGAGSTVSTLPLPIPAGAAIICVSLGPKPSSYYVCFQDPRELTYHCSWGEGIPTRLRDWLVNTKGNRKGSRRTRHAQTRVVLGPDESFIAWDNDSVRWSNLHPDLEETLQSWMTASGWMHGPIIDASLGCEQSYYVVTAKQAVVYQISPNLKGAFQAAQTWATRSPKEIVQQRVCLSASKPEEYIIIKASRTIEACCPERQGLSYIADHLYTPEERTIRMQMRSETHWYDKMHSATQSHGDGENGINSTASSFQQQPPAPQPQQQQQRPQNKHTQHGNCDTPSGSRANFTTDNHDETADAADDYVMEPDPLYANQYVTTDEEDEDEDEDEDEEEDDDADDVDDHDGDDDGEEPIDVDSFLFSKRSRDQFFARRSFNTNSNQRNGQSMPTPNQFSSTSDTRPQAKRSRSSKDEYKTGSSSGNHHTPGGCDGWHSYNSENMPQSPPFKLPRHFKSSTSNGWHHQASEADSDNNTQQTGQSRERTHESASATGTSNNTDEVSIAFGQWKARCDELFAVDRAKPITFFPHLPTMGRQISCQIAGCQEVKAASALKACKHEVEKVLRASGSYTLPWLRKERLKWHPDMFGRKCAPNRREQLSKTSGELFAIIEALMVPFKDGRSMAEATVV